MKCITVADRKIGPGHNCFIAAEIGINHNGDVELAHRTIEAAAAAGVDGVKFQNYETSDFLIDDNLIYRYKSQGNEVIESQRAMFKKCELRIDQLAELKKHCDERGVVFFSTPTGPKGIAELVKIGAPMIKNGSDFLTHVDVVREMAETGLPTILSTGMATAAEIDEAITVYQQAGGSDFILLHCVSSYPTPPEEVNLRRIPAMMSAFGCPVGFSDHTEGNAVSIGAVALKACFIEKHFTIDKSLPGPDHWFSCDSSELKNLVQSIRTLEASMGNSKLGPTLSEQQSRENFRLSCVAACDLPCGTRLMNEHIIFRRPGTGITPNQRESLVGLTLTKSLVKGQEIHWEFFHHE